MADYKTAINKTLAYEGFYSCDPNDSGGETLYGISRKNWPNWGGWATVDTYRAEPNFPAVLKTIPGLLALAQDFYQVNFWDAIGGDKLSNQEIADTLVDTAVNMGITGAIKRAQEICGIAQTGSIDNELVNTLNNLV